jgi:hypothetical protein
VVAFIVERVKDLMNKIFYIPIFLLILTGCDKIPEKVVLDAFENIHSSSVYYVVQNEDAKIYEIISETTSIVELCYEIRRNLGTFFTNECSIVKIELINKDWVITQSLQKDEKTTCWIVDKINPFKVIKDYKGINLKELKLCK